MPRSTITTLGVDTDLPVGIQSRRPCQTQPTSQEIMWRPKDPMPINIMSDLIIVDLQIQVGSIEVSNVRRDAQVAEAAKMVAEHEKILAEQSKIL